MEVVISPSAEREIKKLTKDDQKRIFATLRKLRDGSETLEIEKIKGHPSFFRIKCGKNYRIIYHPMSAERVVVLVVKDRKAAYRNLGDLNAKLQTALQRLQGITASGP